MILKDLDQGTDAGAMSTLQTVRNLLDKCAYCVPCENDLRSTNDAVRSTCCCFDHLQRSFRRVRRALQTPAAASDLNAPGATVAGGVSGGDRSPPASHSPGRSNGGRSDDSSSRSRLPSRSRSFSRSRSRTRSRSRDSLARGQSPTRADAGPGERNGEGEGNGAPEGAAEGDGGEADDEYLEIGGGVPLIRRVMGRGQNGAQGKKPLSCHCRCSNNVCRR